MKPYDKIEFVLGFFPYLVLFGIYGKYGNLPVQNDLVNSQNKQRQFDQKDICLHYFFGDVLTTWQHIFSDGEINIDAAWAMTRVLESSANSSKEPSTEVLDGGIAAFLGSGSGQLKLFLPRFVFVFLV